jgi:hypothetical protein
MRRSFIEGEAFPGLVIKPDRAVEVQGDLKLGFGGQFHASAAEERLRFVRGSVDAAGRAAQGSGFTSARISEGVYRVTFNTPFYGPPNVTATARTNASTGFVAQVGGAVHTHVDISVRRTSNDQPSPNAFEFIAIGPR